MGQSKTKKRIRLKFGDVFKVDLGDGKHAYAQKAHDPLFLFFDYCGNENLSLEVILSSDIIFRLWLDHDVPQGEGWERIGNQITKELNVEPYFFKQDPIDGKLYLYHSEFADMNWEKLATRAEVEGLERAAVFASNHIVDRLNSYFFGLPYKWKSPIKE